MEHGSHVAQASVMRVGRSTDSQSYNHKPDLRDGGESEYAFDVTLYTSHTGSIERSESAYVSNPMQYIRCIGDE